MISNRKLSSLAVSALLAVSVMAPPALADPHGDRRDHHSDRRGGHDDHDRRSWHDQRGWHDRRSNDGYDPWRGTHRSYDRSYGGANVYIYRQSPAYTYQQRYQPPVYAYPYNGYHQSYRIGDHYRLRPDTIYITDYGYWGLRTPPRNHYWVREQDGDDALLISVATGAIIGLVVGAFATGY